MKIHCFGLLSVLLCGMSFVSCNQEDRAAREFVGRFATALAAGNTDTLAVVYPNAAKALRHIDGYRISIQKDEAQKIRVKDLGEGVWWGTIGDSIKIRFAEGREEGQYVIKESHALINFGAERMAFAYATGWVDRSMSDVRKIVRLNDRRFLDWIGADFLDKLKKNVRLKRTGTFGDEYDDGDWICSDGIVVALTNYNDFGIPSEAYEIVCRDWCKVLPADTTVVVVSGEELPPHGKSVQRVDILTTIESASSQIVRYDDAALMTLLFKNYKALGTEYRDYQAARQQGKAAKPQKKEAAGPAEAKPRNTARKTTKKTAKKHHQTLQKENN